MQINAYPDKASGLANAVEGYHNTTSTHLVSLKTASENISDAGAQEDMTTGATPRKRVWEYVDQWSMTKPRENILKTWKEQGISKLSSLTDISPFLEDEAEEEAEPFGRLGNPVESENIPLTNTTSAMSQVPMPPTSTSIPATNIKPATKTPPEHKKSVSSIGTLIDSRNVYTTRGSRRAR